MFVASAQYTRFVTLHEQSWKQCSVRKNLGFANMGRAQIHIILVMCRSINIIKLLIWQLVLIIDNIKYRKSRKKYKILCLSEVMSIFFRVRFCCRVRRQKEAKSQNWKPSLSIFKNFLIEIDLTQKNWSDQKSAVKIADWLIASLILNFWLLQNPS